MEDLANHLRIQEKYRKQDENKEQNTHVTKVHVVEESQIRKLIKKRAYQSTITHKNKKKKKDECFHYGKPEHHKAECCLFKKKGEPATKENFVAMIIEINILEGNEAWWVDFDATRHMCKDKNLFKKYEPVEDGSILCMEKSSTTQVKRKGIIEFEFTSGKTLTLNDVYCVSEVRKTLISDSLLNKFGFKLEFKAD